MEHIVYVKVDHSGYITDINSSVFLSNPTGWTEIDRGYGDKYALAQNNYFPECIVTEAGAYRYKLIDGKPVECTATEIAMQEEANKPDSVPEETTVWDELDAAYQEGVDSV